MAFVLVTSITVIRRAVVILDSARTLAAAGQIMQSEIEKIRLKDWTVVNAYEAGPTAVTIDSSFTANPAIGSRFTLTRTVADVHTDMKSITLTIAWKTYDGRAQSRSYQTYYGRNGLYDYFYNSN